MIEQLEQIGLDVERVRRQRDIVAGLGHAYAANADSLDGREDRDFMLLAAGTNLRRAGADSLLLDETGAAKKFFGNAATIYRRAGTPYGVLLSNLGDEYFEPNVEARSRSGLDIFFLWSITALRWTGEDEVQRVDYLRSQLEDYRNERVGVLELPVGAYLDLFDAAGPTTEERSDERLREALLPIVGTYSSAVKYARLDAYHWKHLAMSFHPVEPDVLALLVGQDHRLSVRRSSVARILETLPLGRDALKLLQGALTQYGAWRHNPKGT